MSQRGFSLAEVLVALGLLVVAALAAAQLLAASAAAMRVARVKTNAATLAAARLDMLRHDPAIAVSPTDSLVRNADGFADYLDADGGVVAAASGEPGGAVFVRRWSVEEAPGFPGLLVVQVLVRPIAEDAAGERVSRGQVRLTTVRER